MYILNALTDSGGRPYSFPPLNDTIQLQLSTIDKPTRQFTLHLDPRCPATSVIDFEEGLHQCEMKLSETKDELMKKVNC